MVPVADNFLFFFYFYILIVSWKMVHRKYRKTIIDQSASSLSLKIIGYILYENHKKKNEKGGVFYFFLIKKK